METQTSHKSYTATLLLTIFLGYLGIHRFYAGKVGTGFLYFISFGLLGIGWLIDIISVASGNFTDKAGTWIKPNPSVTAPGGRGAEDSAEKPFYTRWWFIAIAVVVVLGIISSLSGGDGDDAPTTSETQSESSESADTGASEPTPDSDPEPAPQPEQELEAQPDYSDESVGQANARNAAEGYLSFSSFSRSGLIDQLEFEGYSTEDATYAVDVLEVDWSEQAVGSAESYLDFSAFSRTGLIDQLEFEGFTPEEATYGVDQLGVDWREQAALSAASYLEFSSFSRQGLIDQLVFEGYTREEAEYGVTQVGY